MKNWLECLPVVKKGIIISPFLRYEGHFVQRSGTKCAISEDVIMGNHWCDIILNWGQWIWGRCHLKSYLYKAP